MLKIKAYTDGACSGNPGPGGWAAVLLFPEGKQEISGYEQETTNNRMELNAVIQAIKLATDLGYFRMDVYSDSAYVVNAVKLEWIKKWQLNGWKTVRGENIKNKDLWVKLLSLIKKYRKVNLVKVKGHSGDINNERVDVLAKKAIVRMKRCI